jgi:N utilization substance protein B
MRILYQHDITAQPIDELLENYWKEFRESADEAVRLYACRLARGTLLHLNEIDGLISQRAAHWRLPRMALVDRNILRLAVFEFLYEAETPRIVAINEALEIARRYSTQEATQFINGLLDAIRHDLETGLANSKGA